MLIGGHGRREAALLNQFKTLKCTIEDITPEETISAAARDNNIRDMHWWEWYLVIEGVDKTSQKSQRDIANELGQTQTRVNWALKITKTLNPAARIMVKENIQKSLKNGDYDVITKNKGFSITEQTLLTLAGLEDPDKVQQALQLVLDDYLTADQAKRLVTWVQAGNPVDSFKESTQPKRAPRLAASAQVAESFDPKAANPSASRPQAEKQALSIPISPKPKMGTNPATHTPKSVQATHVNSPITGAKAPQESAQPNLAAHPDGSQQAMGSAETALFEAVAGMSVIAKIRSKIKKGERPNLFEVCLLAGYNLWHGLVWLVKNGFRLTKLAVKWTLKAVKMTWKLLRKCLEIFDLYKYVQAVFILGIAATLLFGAWYVHEHGTRGLVHLVYAKLFHSSESSAVPTPIAPNADSSIKK